MSKEEALIFLDESPQDDIPAAINRGMTQKQAVAIVRKAVLNYPSGAELPYWMERRVWQMHHPIYK